MNSQTSLATIGKNGFPVDDHDVVADRFGPYKTLHRALRGRYSVLFCLIAIGVVLGTIYGFNSTHIMYSSEGLIQIAYTLPAVMQKTDQNEPMQMYEEFLQSQVLRIQSKEVLGPALALPQWRSVVRGPQPSIEAFAVPLLVEHPPHTQAIRVSYSGTDPEVAAAAVRAVIASYMSLTKQNDVQDDSNRLAVLAEHKQTITAQIKAMVASMNDKAQPLKPNQIGIFDELMRDYLRQYNTAEAELEQAKAMGIGENNPRLRAMQAELERLALQIKQYAADFQATQLAHAGNPAIGSTTGTLLPQYQRYSMALTDLQHDLDETNHRIETLKLESASADHRLTVISQGDVPTSPAKDHRVLFAAAGAVGGGILPTMAVALLGLISGRLRYSDEPTRNGHDVPLLGIMPMLPRRISDRATAGIGAHCVHHLRLRLQLMGRANKRVFMITSSTAREGKTSLTLALGLSFASTGAKTLLIDGDTVGRALTFRHCLAHEPGLLAATADPTNANCKPIGDNLWLLPIGQRQELAAASISPGAMDALIVELREKFDYIIIDTGPVLASLEACSIAPSADSVILAIAQGQHDSLVRQAFETLAMIKADVCGYVFNKAFREDYGRTIDNSSSSYFSRMTGAPRRLQDATADSAYSFNPLAQSVHYFGGVSLPNGEE